MSVHVRNYELAEWYLSDHEGVKVSDVMRLAKVIQDTVEAWIEQYNEGRKQDREQSGPDRDERRHEAVEQQRVK